MAAKLGEPSFAATADVGDPDSVAALHADVVARTGQIDILVNNAAIVPFTAWDDVDFAEWRRIMRVNLDGVYLMCRASSDEMRRARLRPHRQYRLEHVLRRRPRTWPPTSPPRAA